MAIARLYVDGEPWEIMGNVTDNFLGYSNTVEASRTGRPYVTTESKVRTVAVDTVKLDIREFDQIVEFFDTCSAKRFNVTVAFNEDCPDDADGFTEYHYVNCVLQGEPEFSPFERALSNFEFAYETRIVQNP